MKKELDYDEIFFELNEIAAKYKWSNHYNENFIYLFERKKVNDDSLHPLVFYVDLYKLNILMDKIEGLIYTPKMKLMMGYFAEMVLFFIPDIAKKDVFITIIFEIPNHKFKIEFSKLWENKFECYV